jgi:hypothetical protein
MTAALLVAWSIVELCSLRERSSSGRSVSSRRREALDVDLIFVPDKDRPA